MVSGVWRPCGGKGDEKDSDGRDTSRAERPSDRASELECGVGTTNEQTPEKSMRSVKKGGEKPIITSLASSSHHTFGVVVCEPQKTRGRAN